MDLVKSQILIEILIKFYPKQEKLFLNQGLKVLMCYSLIPMSGTEVLHWSQAYPDEVKAIIGLDMTTPAAYEKLEINMSLVQLGAFAANVGLTRWFPGISESDAIKNGTLTNEEKALCKAIFYRRTSTQDMINEIKNIKVNAQKVKEASIPKTPMLLFSSNGEETGFDKELWIKIQSDFINSTNKLKKRYSRWNKN